MSVTVLTQEGSHYGALREGAAAPGGAYDLWGLGGCSYGPRNVADLDEHVLLLILDYCAPEDLRCWTRTSRECRDHRATERAWRNTVQRRWRVQSFKFSPRVFGGENWRMAYEAMEGRRRMPRGRFTQKHNIAFAHGARRGLEAWVTLKHREDCMLRELRVSGERRIKAVELRLAVQNVGFAHVEVLVGCGVLHTLNEGGTYTRLRQLGARPQDLTQPIACGSESPKLIAYNGKQPRGAAAEAFQDGMVSSRTMKLVNPLDFAVVTMTFPVPDNLRLETDLLLRTRRLSLPVIVCPAWGEDRAPRTEMLEVDFRGEEFVWKYYTPLPGGIMVMGEDV